MVTFMTFANEKQTFSLFGWNRRVVITLALFLYFKPLVIFTCNSISVKYFF